MKTKRVQLDLPSDMATAIDAKSAALETTREAFILKVLRNAVDIMQEIAEAKANPETPAVIPITIDFPQQALKTYELAATILGISTSKLIARALEFGRIANLDVCREHALKQAREHENDTRH